MLFSEDSARWHAPAVLERLRPLAVPVTLVAGESAKVEVRVSR